MLVSREAHKYHRVNSCNVHYQRSVDPMEGTRPAQISCLSWCTLCTASPGRSSMVHTYSGTRLVQPWRGRVFVEPQCEQTDPARGHTMLASSVLSDSELLLLSSLRAKRSG